MNGFSQKWNGKVGVSIDFGNEVKRVGLSFDINGNCNFIQGNSFIGFYYNFLSWGVQSKTPEIKLGVAAHFGIGKQDNETNPLYRYRIVISNTTLVLDTLTNIISIGKGPVSQQVYLHFLIKIFQS